MGKLGKTATVVAALTIGWVVAAGTVAAAPAPDATKRALLIGVSNYRPPTVTTAGSANDARDLRKVLLDNGWSDTNIRVLIDGDATAGAIREGMDWLVGGSGPDTFSFFHFSGHTKQLQSGWDDGDAEDWDEYLWSVENNFISDGEFSNRLRSLQGHAWINVSNCEAAGFDDSLSSSTRLFTAASQEDEKGYERFDTERSVFTGLLTEAFQQKRGDADRNGVISINEAFDYAKEQAPKQSVGGSHGPQNPVKAGGDGSQWYLKAPSAQASSAFAPQQRSIIPPGIIPPEILRLLPPVPGVLPPIKPQTP